MKALSLVARMAEAMGEAAMVRTVEAVATVHTAVVGMARTASLATVVESAFPEAGAMGLTAATGPTAAVAAAMVVEIQARGKRRCSSCARRIH